MNLHLWNGEAGRLFAPVTWFGVSVLVCLLVWIIAKRLRKSARLGSFFSGVRDVWRNGSSRSSIWHIWRLLRPSLDRFGNFEMGCPLCRGIVFVRGIDHKVFDVITVPPNAKDEGHEPTGTTGRKGGNR